MIEVHWPKIKCEIILWYVLPHIILIISYLLTLQYALNHVIGPFESFFSWFFLMISMVAVFYLLVIEVYQMTDSCKKINLSAYFLSL